MRTLPVGWPLSETTASEELGSPLSYWIAAVCGTPSLLVVGFTVAVPTVEVDVDGPYSAVLAEMLLMAVTP